MVCSDRSCVARSVLPLLYHTLILLARSTLRELEKRNDAKSKTKRFLFFGAVILPILMLSNAILKHRGASEKRLGCVFGDAD